MWLTYHMIRWQDVQQFPSDQKCTVCGKAMSRTESVSDGKGPSYEGYVCHGDRSVIWVRMG